MGRIGQYQLLSHLYHPVFTTESVCKELDIGRINRPDTIDPRELSWVSIVQPSLDDIASLATNRLGPGEISVLAYANKNNLPIVGLDDRQARFLAQKIGLRIIGTIGLLLQSKEKGLIPQVRPFIDQLRQEGFYISDLLVEFASRKANEE